MKTVEGYEAIRHDNLLYISVGGKGLRKAWL